MTLQICGAPADTGHACHAPGDRTGNGDDLTSDFCVFPCEFLQTKRWYHYDDSRVELLAGIETVGRICQRDGYLFFYVNDAISDK